MNITNTFTQELYTRCTFGRELYIKLRPTAANAQDLPTVPFDDVWVRQEDK